MTDEMLNNIPEEEDNIVELTDDDGVVSKFEYLATVPYEGDEYVALLVLDEDGNEPEGDDNEVIILKIEQDENGEDIYVSVDDEELSETVFNLFISSLDGEDEE